MQTVTLQVCGCPLQLQLRAVAKPPTTVLSSVEVRFLSVSWCRVNLLNFFMGFSDLLFIKVLNIAEVSISLRALPEAGMYRGKQ